MKLSPFTLIYHPEEGAKESKQRTQVATSASGEIPDANERMRIVREKAPELAKALKKFNPNLARTLTASTFIQNSITDMEVLRKNLGSIIKELQRSSEVVTVALWDLDTKIGGLPDVLNVINKNQPAFTFFELHAAVPAGLVISSEAFGEWARKRLGQRISKSAQENVKSNFLFSDFYKYARLVLKELGVDFLVGITQHMVAWEKGGEVQWDYHSYGEKNVIMVSTYDCREYAERAGRPFEVTIVSMAIAEVVQAINKRKLEFHKETRGCIFDFNEERGSIVDSFKAMRIDPQCLSLIDVKYREAAQTMVKALNRYKLKAEAMEKRPSRKSNRDDEYYLAELTKLSNRLAKK